jgi:hypothetical protein
MMGDWITFHGNSQEESLIPSRTGSLAAICDIGLCANSEHAGRTPPS